MKHALAAVWLVAGCGNASPKREQPARPAPTSLMPTETADCTEEGWCRFVVTPTFEIQDLYVGADAVYVVGTYENLSTHNRGAIARWDGAVWTAWVFEDSYRMTSIDGADSGDREHIWVCGDGVPLQHLVGDEWVPEGDPIEENCEVAVAGDEVFLALDPKIHRRDASGTWTTVWTPPARDFQPGDDPNDFVNDLSADDAGEVWAILQLEDLDTAPHRFDRDQGVFVPVGPPVDVYRVSVRSAKDVAVYGTGGLRRWDGTQWTDLVHPEINNSAVTHAGTDVMVAGEEYEGVSQIVRFTGPAATVYTLPAVIESLAIGHDGSMWASGWDPGMLWFHP